MVKDCFFGGLVFGLSDFTLIRLDVIHGNFKIT